VSDRQPWSGLRFSMPPGATLHLSIAIAITLLILLACHIVAQETFGYFLGPVLLTTLILPALQPSRAKLKPSPVPFPESLEPPHAANPYLGRFSLFRALKRYLGRVSVVLPCVVAMVIGVGWIVPVLQGIVTIGQALLCGVVLLSYLLALGQLTSLLRAVRVAPALAAAIVVGLGLAWLTWPVWLSPALAGETRLVGWLVWAHPLFAINAVLIDLGAWSEQRIAYHLTNLGQDVAYALPETILPALLVHLGLAGGALALQKK